MNAYRIKRFLVKRDFPLLRLLWVTKWFRWSFLLSAVFLLVALVSNWKVWRTTPPGFLPTVKVSWVDLIQAASLEREARRAQSDKRLADASHAWRSAIANNAGDAGLFKEFLHFLDAEPPSVEHREFAVQYGQWLLRLSRTNVTELELVVSAIDRQRGYRFNNRILRKVEGRLTPPLQRIYLVSLFKVADFKRFEQAWRRAGSRVKEDGKMRLYRAAIAAGWGGAGSSGEALVRLKAARDRADLREIAQRLCLEVGFARKDLDLFSESFDYLKSRGKVGITDHVRLWRLLAIDGRAPEARALAKRLWAAPEWPEEAAILATAYVQLGLVEEAKERLSQYHDQFPGSGLLWVLHGQLLLEKEDWDRLRRLAGSLRKIPLFEKSLFGFSWYLEGRCDLAAHRRRAAQATFDRASERDFGSTRLALQVGKKLAYLGYASQSQAVLDRVKDTFQDNRAYWRLSLLNGRTLDSSDIMLAAAKNLYRLSPGDPQAQCNYAAMLLSRRDRPQEALALTLQALLEDPNSNQGRINHGQALLMNGRVKEALRMLSSVNLGHLSHEWREGLFLALMETHFKIGDYRMARRFGLEIDPQALLPGDRSRYKKLWNELTSRL